MTGDPPHELRVVRDRGWRHIFRLPTLSDELVNTLGGVADFICLQ
jgi:hypothetical protein